jgi:hypothetical protein
MTRIQQVMTTGELMALSLFMRVCVKTLSLRRTMRMLDRMPMLAIGPTPCDVFPTDDQVRLAGVCLGKSLTRSQYLRSRHVSHVVVIGVAGSVDAFRAHAWVAPFEEAPGDFVELQRFER